MSTPNFRPARDPPSPLLSGSTVTCGATRLPRSTVGSGRGLHEMNPCLFQSPAGAAWTFERIAPPQCSPHCIPRHLALSARGASSVWSYRLSWVPPAQGFASPQPTPFVSPVPRFPFGVSADQTLGHSSSICPLFIGALLLAIPRWRRPDAWFTDLPRHRVLRGWSSGSLRNHPLSMVLVYHIRFSLSRVF